MITVLGNLPRIVDYHLLYWYIPTAFKQHFMWFFLLCLSYSLLQASTKEDPTLYWGAGDLLQGLCEIFTLLMVVLYIFEEINQMIRWVRLVKVIKCVMRDWSPSEAECTMNFGDE